MWPIRPRDARSTARLRKSCAKPVATIRALTSSDPLGQRLPTLTLYRRHMQSPRAVGISRDTPGASTQTSATATDPIKRPKPTIVTPRVSRPNSYRRISLRASPRGRSQPRSHSPRCRRVAARADVCPIDSERAPRRRYTSRDTDEASTQSDARAHGSWREPARGVLPNASRIGATEMHRFGTLHSDSTPRRPGLLLPRVQFYGSPPWRSDSWWSLLRAWLPQDEPPGIPKKGLRWGILPSLGRPVPHQSCYDPVLCPTRARYSVSSVVVRADILGGDLLSRDLSVLSDGEGS